MAGASSEALLGPGQRVAQEGRERSWGWESAWGAEGSEGTGWILARVPGGINTLPEAGAQGTAVSIWATLKWGC